MTVHDATEKAPFSFVNPDYQNGKRSVYVSHTIWKALDSKLQEKSLNMIPKGITLLIESSTLEQAQGGSNAYDFKETSVEPYAQLLGSPPLFS